VSELTAGTAVAGYRIESVIGHGSSGSVYAARETVLDRRVALKVLLPELASDPRFRERFLRESRLAAGLEHPSIIPIYAAGESDGLVYLAMRLVEGGDLRDLVDREGVLDLDRALVIIGQVAEALDAAHRRGLVHRDVKPGNILVDESGRAFLCDFGLARHAATVDSLTRDSPFAGTIEYIAPEQINGEEIDGRVDVYALGCVLFESLTGVPPFRRSSEVATVLAHLNEQPPSVTDLGEGLPVELDTVIRRALAKSPDDRYEGALDLVEDARRAAGTGAAPALSRPAQLRTFLIADVRGYTSYTAEHGDEAGAELASTFARLARDVVSRRDGRLVELRGDEALAAFESARLALQAAVELQAKVAEEALPRGVGVGLDAGEAVPVGRGFRGAALNTAARLCARARPGEILATEEVVHLAGTVGGVSFGLRRPERLKGLAKPITAVEVHPAGRARQRQLLRRVSTRTRATSRRARAIGGAALVALVAGAAALVVLLGGGGAALAANSLGIFAADSGKVQTTIHPAPEIFGFINDGDGFWGIGAGGRVLQRIDGRSHTLGRQFALPVSPWGFASKTAFGSLWATDPHEAALLRIDPRYGRVADTIPLPPGRQADGPENAQGVEVTDDAVWVAYGYPKRIARYDPKSGHIVSRQLGNGAFYNALVAAGGDLVWVIDTEGRRLLRLDPRDGSVVAAGRLHPGSVTDARVFDGFLWVAMQGDEGVWQIDRSGAVVGKVATGRVPYQLATGAGAVWVANANSGTVTRIDPSTTRTTTFRTEHRPIGVGVIRNDVWVFVGLGAADARARIEGGNVVHQAAVGNPYSGTDPATFNGLGSWILQYATGSRLMEYRPAPDGRARIVPELSAGAPRVRDGGRVWVFRVRPGFRFSPPSGEPVTAETVRYSLERALSPTLSNPYPGQALLGDLVGLQDYLNGKTPHIRGLTAQGDELRIRLDAPSWTLPARLAMPGFAVVPLGTPVAPDGLEEPIPSAGPYYIDYSLPDFQLVLKKNPNYGGSRPQHADGLIVTTSLNAGEAGELVAQGKADYMFDDTDAPALARGGLYEKRYGKHGPSQRYFRIPANRTYFLLFNTLEGPFANPRIRRAAALALDRRALTDAAGEVPRGLLLPAGIPGYGPRDVFDTAPDLARARALLGDRRVRVLVVGDAVSPEAGRFLDEIRRDLGRVGIDVETRLDVDPAALARRGRPHVDGLVSGWVADYPDAASYFSDVLNAGKDGYFPRWFQDRRWLDRIEAAGRLRGTARAAAYRNLDLALARGPLPLAAFAGFESSPQLFSARVRCRTFLPFFGGLVDPTSLCVS
jgi:ABC-type transport system substrate-binding protein/class 3 adenylate cyclase/streptogramin lyase/tRNA A-37 threonylcarbamoyl transferase component Bud32